MSIWTAGMKGSHHLTHIINGRKKYDGRVCKGKYRQMISGDMIRFVERDEGWGIVCRILSVHIFEDFPGMIRCKGLQNMLPDIDDFDQGVKIYRAFPGANGVGMYGVAAIELEFDTLIYPDQL